MVAFVWSPLVLGNEGPKLGEITEIALQTLRESTRMTVMRLEQGYEDPEVRCWGLCVKTRTGDYHVSSMAEIDRGHAMGVLSDDLRSLLGPERRSDSYSFCFTSAHAIRVQSPTRTVDLIVCFSCENLEIVINNEPRFDGGVSFQKGESQEIWEAVYERIGLAKTH